MFTIYNFLNFKSSIIHSLIFCVCVCLGVMYFVWGGVMRLLLGLLLYSKLNNCFLEDLRDGPINFTVPRRTYKFYSNGPEKD